MITCYACKEAKAPEEFGVDKSRKTGRASKCKVCKKAYDKTRVVVYDAVAKRAYQLTNLYGITVEQYEELLKAQDYKCLGCLTPVEQLTKQLCVDHNHACCPGNKSCGQCVRGLLCLNCNLSLGNARDDADTLRRLAAYIEGGTNS